MRLSTGSLPLTLRACGHGHIGKMFTRPGLVVFRAGAMLAASEMTSPSGAGILLSQLRCEDGELTILKFLIDKNKKNDIINI